MKRLWWSLPLVIAFAMVATTGCGPKMASQETLNQIEECQQAAASARQKIADLEAQIAQLKKQIPAKQQEIQQLQAERDSLNQWLQILEQGY